MSVPGVFLAERQPVSSSELLIGVPVFVGVIHPAAPPPAKPDLTTRPCRFELWPEFQKAFGTGSGYLVDAVRGFFENGGRLCYVYLIQDARLTAETAAEILETRLEALEVLNTVDLICASGLMELTASPWSFDRTTIQHLQGVILRHCARMGDRFALLDSPPPVSTAATSQSATVQQQIQPVLEQAEFLSQFSADAGYDDLGSYGALYFPWLSIESTGLPRWVPPCGHIAGTYARCDRDWGVHHAPANDPLNGVLDLSLAVSDQQQKQLNPKNGPSVNCIRAFRGRGIRVWGVRTLSRDPQWQYVPVRRLFLTLGRWINLHLADVVFEPNDSSLWERLERELSVYCESLRQRGALQGTTSQEAFYVKCNAEMNPLALRELGQVSVELGLAPTIPGEFIRVTLIHGDSGVTLAPA